MQFFRRDMPGALAEKLLCQQQALARWAQAGALQFRHNRWNRQHGLRGWGLDHLVADREGSISDARGNHLSRIGDRIVDGIDREAMVNVGKLICKIAPDVDRLEMTTGLSMIYAKERFLVHPQ